MLYRICCFTMLFVLVLSALAVPLPETLKQAANCRKEEGNLTFTATDQQPFDIYITGKASKRTVKVTLSPRKIEAEELSTNGKAVKLDITRTYPAQAEAASHPAYTLKFRDNEWLFYIDGQLRALMPAVFPLPGTASVQEDQHARIDGGARFLPVPKAAFITNFMIEEGAPNELYPWNIQTGTWHLHTALQQALIRPETDQASAKRAPLTADKSPNFYSLKGGGANVDNIITTGYDFYDNYSLSCSLQLENGEGGIVFYHRDELPPKAPDAKENPKPDPAKAEFYAFTLVMNRPSKGQHEVRLWHQKNGKKRILARAEVPLYTNQWYLPGVAAHGDEIICYLDHCELFRVTEPLPVGGKFGMFLNTPEETRMDDVTVKHFGDIKLDTVDDVKFNILHSSGSVSQGWWGLAHANGQKRPEITLKDNALLALGRIQSQNRVFSTTVEPNGKTWKLGLAAEWKDENSPAIHFGVERVDGNTEIYSLFTSQTQTEPVSIATFKHTLTAAEKAAKSFTLMLDSTEPNKLRCLKDGKLIFLYPRETEFVGANAIWTAKGTKALFTNLELNTERSVFKELKQKNPIFEKDSFMRHWASPEGQWVAGKADAMWHKGDFFTDFFISMPCTPNSDFSIAVPDDDDDGPVSILIRDGKLIFSVKEFADQPPKVQEYALTAPEGKSIETLDYELHYEGYLLWIDIAGKTVLDYRMSGPLRNFGTRARVKGMGTAELARTKVTRTNVIDEFFNESPHDWLANGGDWQIINRFQCTPSWSHMIGEAHQNLGAFWRKQIFKGDMTLEFYAGSRQGAYSEIGNLNCTIMAKDNTAHSGYTVGCTEWDQNQSQKWTTLYKNGEVLAKSDAYTVPRKRKGLKRKNFDPLIPVDQRDVHGAWYYIKLRKIGNKLEYYFDNDLIFSQKEDEPLQEGIIGIWTFLHSMTLAQIKITYDDVRPRPVPVKMLPPEESSPLPQPDDFKWTSTMNGFNVDPLNAQHWSVNDTVGQSEMIPFKTAKGVSAILYRNHLGAGNMQLQTTTAVAAAELAGVAGWKVQIKRTPNARFNAMYRFETRSGDGYKPQRHFYNHITGDFNPDVFTSWNLAGHTDLPAARSIAADDKDWNQIIIWTNPHQHRPNDAKTKRRVKFLGFGLEQRDAMLNGICGNGPGEGYAVGELTPVFYGAPLLDIEAGATCKVTMNGKEVIAANMAELQKALDAQSHDGMNEATLELALNDRKLTRQMAWIKLPEQVDATFGWDNVHPDTVKLTLNSEYPDPRFAAATVQFNGRNLISFGADDTLSKACYFAFKHDQKYLEATKTGELTFSVNTGSEIKNISLALKDSQRVNDSPALAKLDGFTPFFHNFDGIAPDAFPGNKPPRITVKADDTTGQHQYMHIRNTGNGQALEKVFPVKYSIAKYPVIQFRYKAWDMTEISLRFKRQESHYVRLTEWDTGNLHANSTVPVRAGKNLAMDEKWHSWTGVVSDAFNSPGFNTARFTPTNLRFGSVGSPDQTGRFSQWSLDDLVAGPAANSAEQLAFTPTYYDLDGIADIYTATLKGNAPYHDLPAEQQAAIAWRRVAPGSKITPDTAGLSDGINHVLVKAKDALGRESNVTDLPFFWDVQPLAVSHAFNTSQEPRHNGTKLDISFNNHGLSPLVFEQAKIYIGNADKPETISPWTHSFVHNTSANTDTLSFNYPLLFRNLLNNAQNGDTLNLTIKDITDGAGNAIPDYTVPIKINYAADKTGPSWYSMKFSSSVSWFWNWDGFRCDAIQFTPGKDNQIGTIVQLGQSPYLENGSNHANGDLSQAMSWNLKRHPCISFRLWQNVIRPKATLHLVIVSTDNTTYTISLTKPGNAANELNRSQTVKWQSNKPEHFSFNIQQMLKDIGVPQEKIDKLVFSSVRFQRRGQQHSDRLYLDDFFIHGMPATNAPDLANIVAYDASGVASLECTSVAPDGKDEWTYSFATPQAADLNELRRKFQGLRWFRVSAKDKAGNLSCPFWLPIYSANSPVAN